MAKKAQEIADAIYEHLDGDKNYSNYYIGITNDIKRRLFGEHKVSDVKGSHWWIHQQALNEEHARSVEKHFLEKGMQGGTGGGGSDCIHVYCYQITQATIE